MAPTLVTACAKTQTWSTRGQLHLMRQSCQARARAHVQNVYSPPRPARGARLSYCTTKSLSERVAPPPPACLNDEPMTLVHPDRVCRLLTLSCQQVVCGEYPPNSLACQLDYCALQAYHCAPQRLACSQSMLDERSIPYASQGRDRTRIMCAAA